MPAGQHPRRMEDVMNSELAEKLRLHGMWARHEDGGVRANLIDADLGGADLSGAYMRGAYMRGANLSGADLGGAILISANLSGAYMRGADLGGAYMRGAYMRGADLGGADLSGAILISANLSGAYMRGAYMRGAILSDADLSGADLSGAVLPDFGIPEFGPIRVWKALQNGLIAELEIPSNARMTANLVSRKCRASMAMVIRIIDKSGTPRAEGRSSFDDGMMYRVGFPVYPDSYCDDIRIACSPGIHFFLTRKEAEAWL